MFEATTNPAARTAMKKAHAQRSEALASAWSWLFSRTPR